MKLLGRRFFQRFFVSADFMRSAHYLEVLQLYKTLRFMGQSYPSGPEFFNQRLHKAFVSRKDVQDPKEIKALIDKGNYVIKELEALHKLRKYRAMKHAYYDETPPPPSTVPER